MTTRLPKNDIDTAVPATFSPVPTRLATQTKLAPTFPAIPAATIEADLTATQIPCMEPGTIVSSQITSAVLNEEMIYHLYLPPCYDPDKSDGYPLLLLLHGQVGDGQMWINLGLTEKADELIINGKMPPFIIAFPFEKRFLLDSRDSNYDQALLNDLIPSLYEHYAINTQREQQAIGGISRGANWAVQIGMSNPSLFGSIGAHSYPTFGNESPHLPAWSTEIKEIGTIRLAFDIGDQDPYKKYCDAFLAELQKYDLPYTYHVYTGVHNTVYWQAHLEEYLLWYSENW